MITSRSRYVDGNIVPLPDATVMIRRTFPSVSTDPLLYTWVQSDRLDSLAARHLGSPLLWWKIMDANPILQNPADIRPGTQIRIPSNV
jgi:nucleoid-associated protein YgaU